MTKANASSDSLRNSDIPTQSSLWQLKSIGNTGIPFNVKKPSGSNLRALSDKRQEQKEILFLLLWNWQWNFQWGTHIYEKEGEEAVWVASFSTTIDVNTFVSTLARAHTKSISWNNLKLPYFIYFVFKKWMFNWIFYIIEHMKIAWTKVTVPPTSYFIVQPLAHCKKANLCFLA